MIRCLRCQRPITSALGRAKHGMGRKCFAAWQRELGERMPGTDSLLEVGLVCGRLGDGTPVCNVPRTITYHSPDGFEWGYEGSGPADLALNICHILLPAREDFEPIDGVAVSRDALRIYQDFKRKFIAPMPRDGGTVTIAAMRQWIERELKTKETT